MSESQPQQEIPPEVKIVSSIRRITGEFLTPLHENLILTLLQQKNPIVLIDIQNLAPVIEQRHIEDFNKIMDATRFLCNAPVTSIKDLKRRLEVLREKLPDSEKKIIDDVYTMISSSSSSEVVSDADFRLMTCGRFFKNRRELVEINELFIFINSLFEPVQEKKKN